MKKLRSILLIFSAILLVFSLGACGKSTDKGAGEPAVETKGITEESTSAGKDTFTYAIDGDPASINPINSDDRWGLTAVNMMYAPLARLGEEGSQINVLAEDIQLSEDGLTITVKLKEGLKFSDGEAITADDVVFTYETKANKDNGDYAMLWINEQPIKFEKVDDLTVEFKLPEASAPVFENVLTEIFIMPKHIYGDQGDYTVSQYDVDHVGSGPYVLKEYKQGEYLSFEANENYFDGSPSIKKVVLRIVGDPETRKVALQSGEVDASFIQRPAAIKDYDEKMINVYPFSEGRVSYIGFNTASEPLKDKNVRKAIMYALNRNEFNVAAYQSEEYFDAAFSILPPNNPWANPDVETYEQDLEKSKELLAEAGAENLTIGLSYNNSDPALEIVATLVQEQLSQVGITVELRGQEFATLFAQMNDPESTEYDLFINGYIMGSDPDMYKDLYTSDGSSNFLKFSDGHIDELFRNGNVELDKDKRKDIYDELQAYIAGEALVYPMCDNNKIIGISNKIGNVEKANLIPIYSFEDMSKLVIE